jgi:hypothetical protein
MITRLLQEPQHLFIKHLLTIAMFAKKIDLTLLRAFIGIHSN